MILVTGASGHVGRRVTELLTEHGHAVRLMVRDLNKAPQVQDAQIVRGDYADPASLDAGLGSYEAIAAGELEQRSNTVVRFTGREPFGIEAYFAERPQLLNHLRGSPAS